MSQHDVSKLSPMCLYQVSVIVAISVYHKLNNNNNNRNILHCILCDYKTFATKGHLFSVWSLMAQYLEYRSLNWKNPYSNYVLPL